LPEGVKIPVTMQKLRARDAQQQRESGAAVIELIDDVRLSMHFAGGLRRLALETDDAWLRAKVLGKLLEREKWLELWRVVFASKKGSGLREAARDRLFSVGVPRERREGVGDDLRDSQFKSHLENDPGMRVPDREAADLLCDWMARNGMLKPLWSMSLCSTDLVERAAKRRLSSLTKENLKELGKRDSTIAREIEDYPYSSDDKEDG